MKTVNETVDVVIAGGGTAGHVAALQAARAGITTSVIEAGTMLGGHDDGRRRVYAEPLFQHRKTGGSR